MVNAAAPTGTLYVPPPGQTGTSASSLENNQNAGNYGQSATMNPTGTMAPYGSFDGLDSQGATPVGGNNPPPDTTRAGGSNSGNDTSQSCMSSGQLTTNPGNPPNNPLGDDCDQ